MMERSERNILSTLNRLSWLILATMTIISMIFSSVSFGTSVAAGGLIALGNNFWLRSILERILIQQPDNPKTYAIARYILRLTITAVIILLLLKVGINIIGLLTGLSILVISITALSVYLSLSDKGENAQ
ncbi:MAG: ATP synthase subunit I [Geobacteraceae bacterium]|nr:ATP synthase subunit I [Geobacteraceae bacterium]